MPNNRKDSPIQELHGYWLEKKGARRFPARSDLDPLDIPVLLPHIVLVDVLRRHGIRFRFRLVGTAVVELYGSNFDGSYLDDIETGDLQGVIRAGYEETLRTAEPCFQNGVVLYKEQFQIRFDRIILPLGPREQEIDMLLVGMFFKWPSRTRAEDHRKR